MKNYDLSQYMLRQENVLLFPLTSEEMSILKKSVKEFEEYINLPYFAKFQQESELDKIIKIMDMENDYWFLKSQWAVVDIKARAIVGYLRLEQIGQFNKIVIQVTKEFCQGIELEDALNLFYRFLAGNEFVNIVVEYVDEVKSEN